MGEEMESQSFLKKQWSGWKEYYGDRLSILDNYSKFIKGRDKPLQPWSQSDVDHFISSDPVHGPTLKNAREAMKIAATGSLIGAVSTGGFAWKYSKSPHGAALALGAGAVFGWTFGQEVASHYLQLYRSDTMAAQVKFMDWWVNKTEGRS